MTNINKKGFTLLELLVVIAIIAILATAVVLILNPAQLFAQARDSQRISDLNTLRSAVALYLSTVTNVSIGASTNCYVYTGAPVAANCGRHATIAQVVGTTRGVLGAGTDWLPVNFGNIPGGAPLSVLPIDPRHGQVGCGGSSCFYSYVGNTAGGTFEFNADMESARYGNSGSDDVESTDGGSSPTLREVGNEPGLDL